MNLLESSYNETFLLNFLKKIFSQKWITDKEHNGLKVPKPSGKMYVIPDIHGCIKTFRALFERLNLKPTDQLFLLGDYIDRGTKSCETIDYIIDLRNNYNIFPLRGNHEEELLLMDEYVIKHLISKYIAKENTGSFYNEGLKLKDRYFGFFSTLPYFIENEDFIFVHAGFDFDSADPFKDTSSMLEIRNWQYNEKFSLGKTIIHGHNITALDKIIESIDNRHKIIPLDNGCVFSDIEGYRNLLCLCLNSNELIVQENID